MTKRTDSELHLLGRIQQLERTLLTVSAILEEARSIIMEHARFCKGERTTEESDSQTTPESPPA